MSVTPMDFINTQKSEKVSNLMEATMSKGSVIKRPHKDGNGHSWLIKYDAAPCPITGKRRQRYKTAHGSKKEAQAELRSLLSQVDNNTAVDPTKETVAEWLRRWLTDYAPMNCSSGATLERYGQLIEKHIIPALGSIALQKLRSGAVQGLYASKLKDGRLNGEGGLSKRTVHHLHRCLSTSLKVAVSEGLISTNPCDNAKTVKPEKTEIACLDDAQTETMLMAATESNSPTIYALTVLAVSSAMRRGEIAGLQWKDVDLDNGHLRVRSTLEDTKERGLVLKAPKTETSKRKIHLPDLAVSALRAHKAKQNALRLRMGAGNGGERFVFEAFKDDQFGPMRPRAITKMFGAFIAGVDVPRITLHGLRHTAATSAIRAGENIVAVSKRLGHAQVSITLDIYTHYIPGDDEDIAVNWERRFSGLSAPE
jgi:integrase